MTEPAYAGWARLELMGHRTRVGRVSEVEMYGAKLLRIDLPVTEVLEGEGAEFVTEYYGGSSLYGMTPIDEAIVRDYVRMNGDPRPVRPLAYRIDDRSAAGDGSDGEPADEEGPF